MIVHAESCCKSTTEIKKFKSRPGNNTKLHTIHQVNIQENRCTCKWDNLKNL